MKTILLSILSAVIITFLLLGCENEKENKKQLIISGSLIKNSGCKEKKSSTDSIPTPDSLSCAEYLFNASTNKLIIKHLNAGFNCCPENILCEVTTVADTIIITESEKAHLCDCDCLYDLEIEITGVESKEYMIKFIEPYCDNQEQLIFGVNFSTETAGSFCVKRNHYPWGI